MRNKMMMISFIEDYVDKDTIDDDDDIAKSKK